MADRSIAGRIRRLKLEIEHARKRADEWSARAKSAQAKLDAILAEIKAVAP